jgi:hypothetical protein
MITNSDYKLGVNVGTRNHKGMFVRHTAYKLVRIEPSGWAFICQDNSTCQYVDPDSLREMRHPASQKS